MHQATRRSAQGVTDGSPPRALGVALVASVFPPSIGGIQSQVLRLAQELSRRGVEVHVVTRIQPGLAAQEEMGGVAVHRVGLAGAPPRIGSAAFIAGAAAAIVRLSRRVDVVHAHQLLSPTAASVLARPLARRPLVLNPHACGAIGDVGQLSGTAVGRLRLAAAVRAGDAFVAVSRAIEDELVGAGVDPGRIWRIPNGVDTSRFAPADAAARAALRAELGLPAAAPLVVYAGRLAPEKGVDVLLDAWPRVLARVPGAQLCVVGGGAEEGVLRDRMARLGLGRTVAFTGGVGDASPFLRAADAAVLPSRSEGLPVALLEAMACGLPCVATAVGGSREVLEGHDAGWLVPPERPEPLAAALAEALQGGDAARARGEAARARALEHYALDRVAERLLALYCALAARRGGAPAPGGCAPAEVTR